MRTLLCAVILSALAPVPTAAAAQKQSKLVQQLLAMSPADFQQRITLKDDGLDTVARLSSENGFQEKRGLLKFQSYDNFLRAFVDKKTGRTEFQIYQWITYGGDWRFYDTVNFETPAGPDSKQLTVIDRDVTGCSQYGCSFAEHVGFEVDERLLRQIAARANSPTEPIWRFKFGSKSGQEWQDGMSAAEVAGFLAAVDSYRIARGLQLNLAPTPSIAAATPPQTSVAAAATPQPIAVSANGSADPNGVIDLGGGVIMVPAKTKSGFCIRAPADYQGTGSVTRPSITGARPRCTN
jgi:hypothetical protein